MAQASITISDDPVTGQVDMSVQFGDAYDETSQAHAMIATLVESVLGTAKTFRKIDDTVPEVDLEPSKIIVPTKGE